MTKSTDIKKILNINELRELFKNYSKANGVNIALYDCNGEECFFVRNDNCICNFVTEKHICKEHICYSGKKSAELNEPYIFETACGLISCVVPVKIEDEVLAYIVSGPVILWDKDDFFVNEFKMKAGRMGVDVSKGMVDELREVECDFMTSTAKMLGILVNYMVAETNKYILQKEEFEKLKLERYRAQKEMEIFQRRKDYKKYPIELEKELLAYVQLGDKQKAKGIINIFLNEIFSYASGDLGIIKAKLYEFSAFLSRTAVESGASPKDLKFIVNKSSKILLENIDFSDLCFITTDIMNNYIDVVYHSKKNTSIHLAKAIEYINEHYNEKLTLDILAKNIYVSPYYLSHLFREGINLTFSDYLNKIRTDNAKILLMEGKNVETVSEAVGYNDVNYFNKIFKKYIGVSPAKYRKMGNYFEEKFQS